MEVVLPCTCITAAVLCCWDSVYV